jgi:diacylglycerol kinase (ATP)
MTRPRAVLLVNERARRAPSTPVHDLLRAELGSSHELHRMSPRSAGETESMARTAAADGASVVIVAGGDGTINAAANGLYRSQTALGMVPLGTANDLARELGVPRDARQAIKLVARGVRRSLDFVLVNGRGFCTVGGIGLITRSTHAAARAKSRRGIAGVPAFVAGGSIYRMITARELLTPGSLTTHAELRLTDPAGGTLEMAVAAHAVFVTNHRTLGGGIRLPVDSRGDDGVFEIVVVRESARARLMLNFARLSVGTRLPREALDSYTVRRARIITTAPETFVADGETLVTSSAFDVEIVPRSLQMIV